MLTLPLFFLILCSLLPKAFFSLFTNLPTVFSKEYCLYPYSYELPMENTGDRVFSHFSIQRVIAIFLTNSWEREKSPDVNTTCHRVCKLRGGDGQCFIYIRLLNHKFVSNSNHFSRNILSMYSYTGRTLIKKFFVLRALCNAYTAIQLLGSFCFCVEQDLKWSREEMKYF
jgi:hypothetical protein